LGRGTRSATRIDLELAEIPAELAPAYASCERLARAHYENFPVASYLLPRAMRPHVAAIYAFARTADDFADEGRRSADERYRLLDAWVARLRDPAGGGAPPDEHADVFRALRHTIQVHELPRSLFEDLVSAFRQDVETTRYATWGDLLDYCRRSANPVGRLVLRIAGVRGTDVDRASDAVCTALQLTNFWQDLAIDWQRGRLYVPVDVSGASGAAEADLGRGDLSPAWRAALTESAARTRTLFEEGRAVCDAVHGRLRLELRATWLGGVTILERCEAVGFDVFHARPALRSRDIPGLVARALFWSR
jgi:hydroxysqualene synthase